MKVLGSVELTARNGEKFWVDEEDLDVVGDYLWRVDTHHGYIVCGKWSREGTHMRKRNGDTILKGKAITVKLHKEIMEKHKRRVPGLLIDHIDRNRLNNCKSNLRMVTFKQNALNSSRRCDNTSSVTGVCALNEPGRRHKWLARAGTKSKRFYTFEEAVAWRLNTQQEIVKACGL